MRSTNPLMLIVLLLAASRIRFRSSIEQRSSLLIRVPGGRLEDQRANLWTLLNFANPSSSTATTVITMFSTYPLCVRRSCFERSRICSASSLEQLIRIAVRRTMISITVNLRQPALRAGT